VIPPGKPAVFVLGVTGLEAESGDEGAEDVGASAGRRRVGAEPGLLGGVEGGEEAMDGASDGFIN
jgi:hypothetical protein